MIISIIAAVADNLAIGKDNDLIYHIKDDMKRFKSITLGHTVIMGSNTFKSLPKGALPNRRNIVLTRSSKKFEGCDTYNSLEDALSSCSDNEEVFIIGGGYLYKESLDYCNNLYITEIHDNPLEATSFFPEYKNKFICIEREFHKTDLDYDFTKYIKKL